MLSLGNLHVSPKTEIYLDFRIKNAGFVFVVQICGFFSCTISTALIYHC